MDKTREELLYDLERRVKDRILEPTNAALLRKLILNADSDSEAQAIAALGTTYKRTGLHFDKRLERLTDTIHYLRRVPELSFHADDGRPTHRLIIGDNYPALQNLLVEYRNRIDVIYIDPPYGKDSMGQFAETNYENAITRDNLLSMLQPRLQLARQLLSDNGVIFCSIDDRNQAYVKCLFDEVFGERNFVATIVWQKIHSIKNDARFLSECHEYILMYASNIEMTNVNLLPRTAEMDSRYTNPDNDERGPWQSGDLVASGERTNGHFVVTNPKTGASFDVPQGKHWVYSEENIKQLIANNSIYFGVSGDAFPRKKRFLSEVQAGRTPDTLWLSDEVGHNQSATKEIISIFGERGKFDFPKPVKLIQQMLLIASKPDSIILDFFAGSGTTGHAVLELNRIESKDGNLLTEHKPEGRRQFILVQMDEKADTTPNGIARDVTARRLKRIMTGRDYDGTDRFAWLDTHTPYGGSLEVLEVAEVADSASTPGQSPFDLIDETLYGLPRFQKLQEKVDWVCRGFGNTRRCVENDDDWEQRERSQS